jgi:16S rRNA (cytosine967-C5)-methyltransferase
MSVSRARAIAFDVLRRVEAEGAYATDLLHAELGPTVGIKDAALATEIALGVLRWRRLLDFLLAKHLKGTKRSPRTSADSEVEIDRLDLAVALALRMGLYQIRFLERIPVRAAINESVELVKRARKASAASLVNAVLRRMAHEGTSSELSLRSDRTTVTAVSRNTAPISARSRETLLQGLKPSSDGGGVETPPFHREALSRSSMDTARDPIARAEELFGDNTPPAERIAILHSHPLWMVERWLARFGEERTLGLAEADNRAPRLSCAIHDLENRDEILEQISKAGLRIEPGALLKNAFAVAGGSVITTGAFRNGAISIQDEASQAIPLLLGVQAGDRLLDLCAAPGGKTPPLVRAAGATGMVVASDRHAHRLRAMRQQFERLRLAGVHSVELDAEKPLPFRAEFDRILVDAPCSGTGTLARHPEIRWRLKPEQLTEFHQLQVAILTTALEALAPGGRLVYSTCSLEPEENEEVVEEMMSGRPGVRVVPASEIAGSLAPRLAEGVNGELLFDASGYFRTFPGEQPTDGFFAAVLEKEGWQRARGTSWIQSSKAGESGFLRGGNNVII